MKKNDSYKSRNYLAIVPKNSVFISRIRRPKPTIFLEKTGFFGGTQKNVGEFRKYLGDFLKTLGDFLEKVGDNFRNIGVFYLTARRRMKKGGRRSKRRKRRSKIKRNFPTRWWGSSKQKIGDYRTEYSNQ